MQSLLNEGLRGTASEFFGIVAESQLKTLDKEDKSQYDPPEVFVGGRVENPNRLPKTLPAKINPKFYEPELKKHKMTYEKTFQERNVVAFENWGIHLRKKQTHVGWALKSVE